MLNVSRPPAGTIDLEQLAAAAGCCWPKVLDDDTCDRLIAQLAGYEAVWSVEVLSHDAPDGDCCVSGRLARNGRLPRLWSLGVEHASRGLRVNLARLLAQLEREYQRLCGLLRA